jgi:hypothetical protein
MADEIRTDLHDLRTRDFFHGADGGADRLDRIRRLPREVERDEPGLTDTDQGIVATGVEQRIEMRFRIALRPWQRQCHRKLIARHDEPSLV